MARKPRPIDPNEGPLQAFAHELRAVRDQAGNPTYRALATLAGFGASTLSDAAGGVRQPSLEVTLAYVGACGGDVELWQRRWEELTRTLAEQQPRDAGGESESGSAADGGEPDEDKTDISPTVQEGDSRAGSDLLSGAPDSRRRRWSRRYTVVAAAVLATACGVLAVRLPAMLREPKPVASACPDSSGQATTGASPGAGASPSATPAPSDGTVGSTFKGQTYGPGAHIRAGASLNAPVVRTVLAGCTLRFSGYCLGDVIMDSFGGSPDMRWFILADGGVVASSIIHGNPPTGLAPSHCPDDVPMAADISLSITQPSTADTTVELMATGSHLGVVGYAAFYATGGSENSPSWHQISMNANSIGNFAVAWRLGPLRGTPGQSTSPAPADSAGPADTPSPTESPSPAGSAGPAGSASTAVPSSPRGAIPLVGVACLGGDMPTGAVDAKLLPPDIRSTPQPLSLAPDDLSTAARAACHYPHPVGAG